MLSVMNSTGKIMMIGSLGAKWFHFGLIAFLMISLEAAGLLLTKNSDLYSITVG